MQLVFVLLVLLLLAVALFALQNPDPVTLRFLSWRTQSSVAVLTLGATATGAVIAALLGLASRLRRWQRARVTTPGGPLARASGPATDLPPPGGPSPRPGA